MLQRIAIADDPQARVWRGSGLLEGHQGIRVLGAPIGHPAFIANQSENLAVEHQTLLDGIPSLKDLCCTVRQHVPTISSEW